MEDLNQGTNKTHLSILEEDFIVELIHVLVKAFLSFSDSGTADSCSFSIQEVLRAYEITGPGKPNSLSQRGGFQSLDMIITELESHMTC